MSVIWVHHFDSALFFCSCSPLHLYVGIKSTRHQPRVGCALTAHLKQAPPLQHESYVFAASEALACIYSRQPFSSCFTVSLCVCAVPVFSSAVPSCLSFSCYPSPTLFSPQPLPSPHSFAHSLFLIHTPTHTCTLSLAGSQPLTTVCLQKSCFFHSFLDQDFNPSLFFALVLEFNASRIH